MKIAIDAGHGQDNRRPKTYDTGATVNGISEAAITLAWALTLKQFLVEAGIEVFLTRIDPMTPAPLSKRVARAKEQGCTHLISLHCNANEPETARGTETYYRPSSRDWAAKLQAATVAGFYSFDDTWRNRGIKPEGDSQHSTLAILGGGLTSALIELGFIDHGADRALLTSRDARIAVCQRLVEAITEGKD